MQQPTQQIQKPYKAFVVWRRELVHLNKTRDQRVMALCHNFHATLIVRKTKKIGEHIYRTGAKVIVVNDQVPFIGLLLFYLKCLIIFTKLNYREKYDVVYSLFSEEPIGFLVWLISLCKPVWIVDLWDRPDLIKVKFLSPKWLAVKMYLCFLKLTLKYVDIAIVAIRPEALVKYKIAPQALLPITNGIDLSLFDPEKQQGEPKPSPSSIIKITYVGHIMKERGMNTLIEACGILHHKLEIKNIRLQLIGFLEEADKDWLKNYLLKFQINEITDLYVNQPSHKIPSFLTQADICVHPFPNLPGLSEIYPIKVYEYLAMGKAVVASNLPGVATIIHDGENGLLFNDEDPIDLADKIHALLVNPPLKNKLQDSARQSILDFSWHNVHKQLFHSINERIQNIKNRPAGK